MQANQKSSKDILRQQAEKRLKTLETTRDGFASEGDILKVFYELQVYQIELEMQNEELMAAMEKAENSERKYVDLYESAPSGYLSLSMEGEILELNNSAAQLLHKDLSKLVGNRLSLFISDDTRNIFNEFIGKLSNTMDKETCEVTMVKDGKVSAYVTIDGIKSSANETILLSMVDITKSKQAEESLRQLEVDREALKFKQSFLANMSHEIRTPLTGVLGMIDILEHTKLTAEQKEYFSILKLSGENLKLIVNQVLDYSKIEAGKIKLKPSLFSLSSLLSNTRIHIKGRIKADVEFNIRHDENIPEFICADEKRINQVLNNLVANAMKFTPKGSILISSQLLTPNAFNEQIMIKVSVTDTGIGIPAEMQNKLFVPFSQIDDKDTREYEGTGLGLSICKELVMLLGGKIGVVSEYHKGSTFWFNFPAQVSANPSKISPALQNHEPSEMDHDPSIMIPPAVMTHKPSGMKNDHHSNGKLRILFADDKVVNQKVISLILTTMGHIVTTASNGDEAIRMFKPDKFDLILMDIQMPVMDGITATQKLKKKYKDLPPIVGLSAGASEGDREKYLALGMDDYLTKPVNEGDFKKLIARLRN